MNEIKSKFNMTKMVFCIYFLILIWVVLFKMAVSFSEIPWFDINKGMNFEPFYYSFSGRLQKIETIMNVVAFIPFGIYLKMLNQRVIKTIFYGFGLSVLFELFQFAFAVGVCDITDVITNTFGTIVGVCLYAFLNIIISHKKVLDGIINTIFIMLLTGVLLLAAYLFIANNI